MGQEIDLMINYPRTKRDPAARGASKTPEQQAIARQFGKEFFDGSRDVGYGGFSYMSRFWEPVIPTFQEHFDLKSGDVLLDIGCAKGFMMYDAARLIPGLEVKGIDVSEYAIENGMEEMKPHMQVASAVDLPFEDNSVDVSISITTLHNLEKDDLATALREIERVTRRGSFITLDAYRNDEERERMEAWNLTALTMMHVDEWKEFFDKVGYTGDYYWFIP